MSTIPWEATRSPGGQMSHEYGGRMKEQIGKNGKSTNRNSLELGDQVTYTVETDQGSLERAGKILLMDGTWCVVRLRSKKLVWVSLRCL